MKKFFVLVAVIMVCAACLAACSLPQTSAHGVAEAAGTELYIYIRPDAATLAANESAVPSSVLAQNDSGSEFYLTSSYCYRVHTVAGSYLLDDFNSGYYYIENLPEGVTASATLPEGFESSEVPSAPLALAEGATVTVLKPDMVTVDKVNAVVLTGGSAYGLAACDGVVKYLAEKGAGFRSMGKVVPLVTGAVIYDLNQNEIHAPDAKMGYEACKNAITTPLLGQNGVGKGATLGKIRGQKYDAKSGVGACTVKVAGVTLTAIVAVNALGDVFDPEQGKIVAGARANDGSFLDTERHIVSGGILKMFAGANTTIGCLLTNAKLDKVGANKLASAAQDGLARAIRPVHTDFDGDTVFCLSSDKVPVVNFMLLQTAAAYVTERAIIAAATSGAGCEVCYEEDGEAEEK